MGKLKVLQNFRQAKLHKRIIIPWSVAEDYNIDKDVEVIRKFKDLEEDQHYYKEGDMVAHTGNTELKMFVSELLYEGRPDEDKKNSKKSMFIGLLCHWWEKILYDEDKVTE